MNATRTLHSKEEFARRGDEIYEREVRPRMGERDQGRFVAIDIDSGDFEVAEKELEASDRLLARKPGAQVWMLRVGSRYTRRFGCRGEAARG